MAEDVLQVAGAPEDSGAPALLAVKGVSKTFPGVTALDDVSLELRSGEVHVLLGENGAGKSTLISLIAGVHRPSAGEIEFRGRPIQLGSVHQARQLGRKGNERGAGKGWAYLTCVTERHREYDRGDRE